MLTASSSSSSSSACCCCCCCCCGWWWWYLAARLLNCLSGYLAACLLASLSACPPARLPACLPADGILANININSALAANAGPDKVRARPFFAFAHDLAFRKNRTFCQDRLRIQTYLKVRKTQRIAPFLHQGWNDPCLLLAEDWTGRLRITQLQTRAQFSMWAVMASPLIISANIRNMVRWKLDCLAFRVHRR